MKNPGPIPQHTGNRVSWLYYIALSILLITFIIVQRSHLLQPLLVLFLLLYTPFSLKSIIPVVTLLNAGFCIWLLWCRMNGVFGTILKRFQQARLFYSGVPMLIVLANTCIIVLFANWKTAGQLTGLTVIFILLLICLGTVVFITQQTLILQSYSDNLLKGDGLLQEVIAEKKEKLSPISSLILKGDNKSELLEIEPSNLLYLHAADNYTRIFFMNNGHIDSILFRGTLKKFEETLAEHDFLFRCHKTYLVNLLHVHLIKGNALGLKLYIMGVANPVPVSRNLNKEILERLSHLGTRGAYYTYSLI